MRQRLLVVVDYQNDFVIGPLGFPEAKALDGRIVEIIAATRRAGGDVAFTLDSHCDDYATTSEGRHSPIPHCLSGSEGEQLYGNTAFARLPQDYAFTKHQFTCNDLCAWLRDHPYEQVVLVGLVSYQCVLSNAVAAKAVLPESDICVDAACTAGEDPVLHRKALDVMQALHISVINRPGFQ